MQGKLDENLNATECATVQKVNLKISQREAQESRNKIQQTTTKTDFLMTDKTNSRNNLINIGLTKSNEVIIY